MTRSCYTREIKNRVTRPTIFYIKFSYWRICWIWEQKERRIRWMFHKIKGNVKKILARSLLSS